MGPSDPLIPADDIIISIMIVGLLEQELVTMCYNCKITFCYFDWAQSNQYLIYKSNFKVQLNLKTSYHNHNDNKQNKYI